MRKIILIPVIVLCLLVAGLASWYYNPEHVAKREVEALLQEFSNTVSGQDRAAIAGFLNEYLSPDASIDLNVTWSMVGYRGTAPLSRQHFDRESFIRFIDNLLYSLDEYQFQISLEEFKLLEDTHRAEAKTYAWGKARGGDYRGGMRISQRYGLVVNCTGTLLRGDTVKPRLQSTTCTVGVGQNLDR